MATMTVTQSIARSKHALEKTSRVVEEIATAKTSLFAMLSYCWLLEVPGRLFQDEEFAESLKRLDLSQNYISELPNTMGMLVNLREIWLSHNPLTVFPKSLLSLKKLEVIDISHTKISEVLTLVIDLQSLLVFDWRSTPMEANLKEQFQVQTNDLRKLQQVMRNINIRSKTCVSLDELLNGEIYLMDVDKAYTKATIAQFIEVSPTPCPICLSSR